MNAHTWAEVGKYHYLSPSSFWQKSAYVLAGNVIYQLEPTQSPLQTIVLQISSQWNLSNFWDLSLRQVEVLYFLVFLFAPSSRTGSWAQCQQAALTKWTRSTP